MAVRAIRHFGDPVLKAVSRPITVFDKSVEALAKDLEETTALPGRAGVAAPQIGVNLRGFSYNIDGVVGSIFNPEIVELSGEKVAIDEGCLSVPELWHKTPRYEFAKVKGFDAAGKPIELSGRGLMAQMLQHECDHLDGLLYLDRLEPDERKLAFKALRETSWFLKN